MATILEAVGDYLVTNHAESYYTQASNPNGTMTLGYMPDHPDSMVTIYENSGQSPQFTLGSGGIAIDMPMVQVLVRGAPDDYVTPRDKIDAIRSLLATVLEITVTGVNIMRLTPMGNINALGVDSKRRFTFSVNFSCLVRK